MVVFEVESHIIHSSYCERGEHRFRIKVLCESSMTNCVLLFTLPVPLRHCRVVVNPLVRGSRWYLSLGRPLLSATCILIWCLASVKRVPSQYSRNCGDKRAVLTHADTYKNKLPTGGDLFSRVPFLHLILHSVLVHLILFTCA